MNGVARIARARKSRPDLQKFAANAANQREGAQPTVASQIRRTALGDDQLLEKPSRVDTRRRSQHAFVRICDSV
jgi:hypothetical protein